MTASPPTVAAEAREPQTTEAPPALRPELAGLLSAVRSRLRRYTLLRGSAVLALTAVGVFWSALWLDDLYFFVTPG